MKTASEALNQLLDRLEDEGKLGTPGTPDPEMPLEVLAGFENWAESTGRALYPHQKEAAEHIILEDRHLIAPTPTGSGKSLIGVAAILWALARGEVAYYTAPLKALVSEKFFDLVDLFGAQNVGMVTGDGSVNADAPIICATAEILANQALRWGEALDVGTVVMDEFHYYGEAERGWAWQAPLLTLPKTRFVLMSATLGDMSFLERDLERRTGREVAVLTSAKRPVPLEMAYRVEPVEKLLVELSHQDKLPAYLVHSSQRAAVEEAQRIASLNLDFGVTDSAREQLANELKTVKFTSAFGRALKPLLAKGIGIHHAGMLPRYRRLVERLAGAGLLKVISGTDTLGVGINVPIRTVIMTSLVKFDGNKERHLNAREFHQIAGRAGRAGFDTIGYVFALAPEWEVENALALARAKDPKKAKKKKAPEGRTTWSEGTFNRLVDSEPGALAPHWQINHAMVLNTLQRPGDQEANLRSLADDNHNVMRFGEEARGRFETTLAEILESLTVSGVISGAEQTGTATTLHSSEGTELSGTVPTFAKQEDATPNTLDEILAAGPFQLTAELPEGFALNQTLAPFALDYLGSFSSEQTAPPAGSDPSGFTEILDIISVVEAVLDDPNGILRAQERSEKDRVFAELKAAGVDFDERKAALEKVTYPRPLEKELNAAFEIYTEANPWAKGFRLEPKSIVREMVETGATFTSYIARLGAPYTEGLLLRYLSDAWRALSQIVPEELRSVRFVEVMDWLSDTIRKIDSSLLDEWRFLEDPGLRFEETDSTSADELERAFGERPDGSFDWEANPAAAENALLKALMPWLEALGGDEFELLARMEKDQRALANATPAVTGPSGYASLGHPSPSPQATQQHPSPLATLIPEVEESGWDKQLGAYWDAHDFMDTGADGRNKRNFRLLTDPDEADFPRGYANPATPVGSDPSGSVANATTPPRLRSSAMPSLLEHCRDLGSGSQHEVLQAERSDPPDNTDAKNLWLGELTLVDGEDDLDFALFIAVDPTVTLKPETEHSTETGAPSGLAPTPAWVPLGLFER